MNSRPTEPEPLDQRKWDDEAVKFHVDQLTRVHGIAEKWTGTVATLLGIFSSVAIVSGAATLDKVTSEGLRWTIFGLVAAAGIAAIVSIVTGALAAQGTVSTRFTNWDGHALRSFVTDETPKAACKLTVSRYTGSAAAGLVFLTGLLGLLAAALPGEAPSPASVVVVDGNGQLRCGKLQKQGDGTVTLDGKSVPGRVSQVTAVSKC